RVMRAQVLGVDEFQSAGRNLFDDAGKRRQLTSWKNMALDKLAAGWRFGATIRTTQRNAMVKNGTTRFQQSDDRGEIEREVGKANVLVHAHGDHLVELV